MLTRRHDRIIRLRAIWQPRVRTLHDQSRLMHRFSIRCVQHLWILLVLLLSYPALSGTWCRFFTEYTVGSSGLQLAEVSVVFIPGEKMNVTAVPYEDIAGTDIIFQDEGNMDTISLMTGSNPWKIWMISSIPVLFFFPIVLLAWKATGKRNYEDLENGTG